MRRVRSALAVLALALAGVGGGAASAAVAAVTGPRRLAVLSPSAAETLAALGASDQVAAVGDWITWPPELARLPKLGSYDAPSEESLFALHIDTLVTTSSVAGREGRQRLEKLGIRVEEVDTSTLSGALAGIETVGALVGRDRAARQMVERIRAGLARVRSRAAGARRRPTLVVVGREPLFVAGRGSYLDELVTLAGGSNVAADLKSTYAMVSLEEMLARRPEVIVDLSDNQTGAPRGAGPGSWGRYSFVPAVKDRGVWFVDPSRLSIPGPRLVEMAEEMGRLIHPEIFGRPTPRDFSPLGAAPPEAGR